MKKTYQKPRVYAESFELLEHIASCAVRDGITNATYRDRDSCSYTDGDITLFYDSGNGCLNNYGPMYDSPDDFLGVLGGEDSGCYNAFSNGNTFAS